MLEHINKPMFVMGGGEGINYLLDNNSNKYIKITTNMLCKNKIFVII